MELILALILIMVFDMAALRWGIESGDDWCSPQWERRRNWAGFH